MNRPPVEGLFDESIDIHLYTLWELGVLVAYLQALETRYLMLGLTTVFTDTLEYTLPLKYLLYVWIALMRGL